MSEEKKEQKNFNFFNVNVGILGHVDSGKTTLSKALSTLASTNAFDKSPQSKDRGITLDLGFSAFVIEAPEKLKQKGFDMVEFCLVDCPGHASLIKTIIGGSQIIDFMVLVIDATKGIQTQTAECIVIGEITSEHLIVVLNKIDQIDEEKRDAKIDKLKTSLMKTVFSKTKFKNVSMIPVSVNPKLSKPIGVDLLMKEFEKYIPDNKSSEEGKDLLIAVDHCFQIKGKGTILTGTILSGILKVNQDIEIPSISEKKKVKSIQMFKNPVKSAQKGDRIGFSVANLDSSKFERGYICDVGRIPIVQKFIARVEKIRYFKGKIENKTKFHITIGHSTTMGVVKFFESNEKLSSLDDPLDESKTEFFFKKELSSKKESEGKVQYCLIELESSIPIPLHSKFIASKLDTDITLNACRLAFHGVVLPLKDFSKIRVFKTKEREALVDRIVDSRNIIGKNLIKKGQDISKYIGLNIETEDGIIGRIESSFGSSGKFKVGFSEDIPKNLKNLKLKYKINIFDDERKWYQ
eukprot:gene9788-2113_t